MKKPGISIFELWQNEIESQVCCETYRPKPMKKEVWIKSREKEKSQESVQPMDG
jgi:hypothetical protein